MCNKNCITIKCCDCQCNYACPEVECDKLCKDKRK